VASDLVPSTDNTYDLGVTGHEWRNLNIDGTANIDSLVADTADINGGTIDATAIGGSTAAAGAFTTLTTSGNTTLGDASTDTVTVNGYMGVGGGATSSRAIQVLSSTLTGTTQVGILSQPTANSSATAALRSIASFPIVQDSAFTVPLVAAFYASVGLKGASATATNWHGIYIDDQTQGTNNFGVTSIVSSGTNKWNIYASGTAANYFAGNVQFAAGSAAAPALTRFGDTNTGIFFPAADTIAFAEGGVERMRIDTAGNVGIGTSSPTNLLHVRGTAPFAVLEATGNFSGISFQNSGGPTTTATIVSNDAGEIQFRSLFYTWRNADASSERMRITSAGNVGIGTAFPAVKLDVAGTINSTGLAVTGALSATTSVTTPLLTNAGTLALNATGANIITASTNGSERLRITSAGDVGIGTTSPGSKLDVDGELRIGNTVAAAVAVASTHKVTIVIGGVTYYLLASDV
jgi:hypothetical protein